MLLSLLIGAIALSTVQGQSNGQIRLVSNNGSTTTSGGRLEIYYRDQWGTVCRDDFGSTDALVVCRELGYNLNSRHGSVGLLGYSQPDNSSTPIWLDDVRCASFNTALRLCSHGGIGIHNCQHSEDIAVECTNTLSPTTGQIRLVTNNGFTTTSGGRLEIYYNDQWGTVCHDDFGSADASVVCRELGYNFTSRYGRVGLLEYSQGSSSTPIWLDDIGCTSSDTALRSCSNRGIGVHNCGHFEDVAVECTNTQPPGQIRLVSNSGSTTTSAGRLEIYYNDQWGTVCDDDFGLSDARVVCRELGYTFANRYGRVGSLGYNQASSSTQIWLDNVGCTTSDTALRDCSSNRIGIHNCGHSEDVAVECSNTQDIFTGFTTNIVGIAVGISVAVLVLFVIIPIIICVVCVCVCGCCGAAAASRSNRHTAATVTTTHHSAYPMETKPPQ